MGLHYYVSQDCGQNREGSLVTHDKEDTLKTILWLSKVAQLGSGFQNNSVTREKILAQMYLITPWPTLKSQPCKACNYTTHHDGASSILIRLYLIRRCISFWRVYYLSVCYVCCHLQSYIQGSIQVTCTLHRHKTGITSLSIKVKNLLTNLTPQLCNCPQNHKTVSMEHIYIYHSYTEEENER